MKKTYMSAAALLMTTTAAGAGGLDRSGNAYAVLFESGNYVELSFSSVRPDLSGTYPTVPGLPFQGGSTGNMTNDFSSAGGALKIAATDQLDIALFLNKPYGADALYTGNVYDGLGATWDSNSVAVVLKYQLNPNISVYGGARSVESQAEIQLPGTQLKLGTLASLQAGIAQATAAGNAALAAQLTGQLQQTNATPAAAFDYSATTEADRQTSYIAGVAYERPEIALRVALTYETGFTHSFDSVENSLAFGLNNAATTTEIEMPQAVTLDFQSGVAADTLVFGSIRYSDWSVWQVRPEGFTGATGARVTGLDNNVTTMRLGVGRRLNEDLSVFGRVTYEKANGGTSSLLAPSDGSTAIGIGGTYTRDNIKLTGGIEYVMLGDTTDNEGPTGIDFSGNSAVGVGLSIGYSF